MTTIITAIEAEVLRCELRCKCGRPFSADDFCDIDNVLSLKCGGLDGNKDGCGATPLAIVFGSDWAREFWVEEHEYAEPPAAQ
jgi:hypothetical protein